MAEVPTLAVLAARAVHEHGISWMNRHLPPSVEALLEMQDPHVVSLRSTSDVSILDLWPLNTKENPPKPLRSLHLESSWQVMQIAPFSDGRRIIATVSVEMGKLSTSHHMALVINMRRAKILGKLFRPEWVGKGMGIRSTQPINSSLLAALETKGVCSIWNINSFSRVASLDINTTAYCCGLITRNRIVIGIPGGAKVVTGINGSHGELVAHPSYFDRCDDNGSVVDPPQRVAWFDIMTVLPDMQSCVFASSDHGIRLMKINDKNELYQTSHAYHRYHVYALAGIRPSLVISSNGDRSLNAWDMSESKARHLYNISDLSIPTRPRVSDSLYVVGDTTIVLIDRAHHMFLFRYDKSKRSFVSVLPAPRTNAGPFFALVPGRQRSLHLRRRSSASASGGSRRHRRSGSKTSPSSSSRRRRSSSGSSASKANSKAKA